MSAIEILPSLKRPDPFDEERFLKFLESRPEEERWELIGGEPIYMPPASVCHQIIAATLARLLSSALRGIGSPLIPVHEVGLAVESVSDFRPIADLVVIDPGDIGRQIYATRFFLVAEVVSQSNTSDHISTKRKLYAQLPDCQHVLILSQTDLAVEVWSRSRNWEGRVYRSPDDRIELPEFGFSCSVDEIYAHTDLLRGTKG
ncbi:Uma2 family endonuclease [Jiella mangrovi]|uniref:Uma2 family endonuclease n=1 Tax=Jiella mangrovi TaxID=2821407 RepID=A0ABS4BD05_9HYPH|nr:Uma2 family endonuclease [Jiella mangrovi]MBP0614634.1 Uma2 family endonuclease [Jiella mangrovi]